MADARRLSDLSDSEMAALTGTSGMRCDRCQSTAHNTAGHTESACLRCGRCAGCHAPSGDCVAPLTACVLSPCPQTPEDCPEPYWHETHRYCPACSWHEEPCNTRPLIGQASTYPPCERPPGHSGPHKATVEWGGRR